MVWGETTDFCITPNTLKMNKRWLKTDCYFCRLKADHVVEMMS